jgi:F-type H+-transporting ATPase subunit b
MLEVDIKIIIVQIATFLVGIFVLWKLAWKPLVVILSKRKDDILKNIADAQNMKLESEKLQNEYQSLILELDRKTQEMLNKAVSSGEQQKQQIILSARDEAKNILEMARKQIDEEKENIKKDLRQEIVPIAISIAENILEKNIDKNTQKQLIEKFLNDISTNKQ